MKEKPLISVKDLHIGFKQADGGYFSAVKKISFDIPRGEITAVVGESGSGKSLTAFSLIKLLPDTANLSGEVLLHLEDRSINMIEAEEALLTNIRGVRTGMIFQEPMTSLNPVYSCGDQVMETILQHENISKAEARERTLALFEKVKLPNPQGLMKKYPHQISGGQKQRVMIAIAICCNPDLLIADEPTTALDVRVQKSIMQLLKELCEQEKIAVLLISHDLALVSAYASQLIVMQQGTIVEQGRTDQVMQHPTHAYTKALLACKPTPALKGKTLPVIADFTDGKAKNELYAAHEPIAVQKDHVVLEVKNLVVKFPVKKNIFGKPLQYFTAVNDVSFEIFKNETIGLVGESGCGKTTLGRTILKLIKPFSGTVLLEGKDIATLNATQTRIIRKDMQIVFQDPYGSLNPRLSIGDAITEPMKVHGMYETNKVRKDAAVSLLEQVGLQADHFKRYPHQFSGGQRQRICIARALALNPSFLVFDESVSALDVSVQAQVLNLIQDLKRQYSFTAVFISHDLNVVHYISDRIMVMHEGRIVESGESNSIMNNPKEQYTIDLLSSIPVMQYQGSYF